MHKLIAIVLLAGTVACAEKPAAPVHLLYNAVIYTVNPAQAVVGAMAYDSSGVIVTLGREEVIRAGYTISSETDAQGQTVIPGFIDSHAHLMGLGISLLQVRLDGTASRDEIVGRLQAFAERLPEGSWLTGRGWDQNDWPEQQFPSRHNLDGIFPELPVWLRRIDGHAAWANSAALRAAGLMEASDWQPEGGYIHRDDSGLPDGVLVDRAMGLVDRVVPPISDAEQEKALDLALETTARFGLTGVHDAGISLAVLRRYQRRIDAGSFPLRVYAMAGGRNELFDRLCDAGPVLAYGGKLTARSVKHLADGALGSRGAALHTDYSDDPGNQGLLIMTTEALADAVSEARECGLQVGIHAIGDLANTVVMDAYESALQQGNNERHRIEHVQVIRDSDITRMAALGVIAAMQPTHATSDMYWAEDRLGSERIQGAYVWRKMLDAGVVLSLGSDVPVESGNPLHEFYAAVTRKDLNAWPEHGWYAQQVLSRQEALKGLTLGAAFAAFQEDQLGSLEPGKRADFVILSSDIMQMDADKIPQTRVVATYIDGQLVYSQ